VDSIKPKSAIIFGGSGFIGTHLAENLKSQGYSVVIADLVEPFENSFQFFQCDVRKRIEIKMIQSPSVIFNLAAVHRTPGHAAEEYYETNVKGAENVTNWASENGVKKVIFTSSISVYGPNQELLDESCVTNPVSDYGKSKLLAEKIVLNSNLNKGKRDIKLSVVRFGNVIGTRGSVLPKFISQIKENKSITVADKTSTRFFVTIEDAVQSIFETLETMKGGEIVVPRTINSIKIYDLARAIVRNYGKSESNIKFVGLRQSEKTHEKIFTDNEFYNLKFYKNIFIIDYMNLHKLPKVNKKMNFFYSDQAKTLSVDEIIRYLKKFNLLDV
jgi:FlaA1/EpsC-like NDP-sugar epimerase